MDILSLATEKFAKMIDQTLLKLYVTLEEIHGNCETAAKFGLKPWRLIMR